jgi:hypothetical protein
VADARRTRVWRWLQRWGISVASFVAGCLSLLVFRRGLPRVSVIIGYLLLVWLLFVVITVVQRPEASRARRFVVTATEYTIQTLFHGLLLFSLPAYYASATLTSVNAPFVLVILALALLATFDPWYRAVVEGRPYVRYVFLVVSTFAALALALPLVRVPPYVSLLLSAWISVFALAPAIQRARGWRPRQTLVLAGALAFGAAAFVGLFPGLIPPVPLSLSRAVLTWSLDGLEPTAPLGSPVAAADLTKFGSMVAYTAIYAPQGVTQGVVHVWRRDGKVVNVVPLSPVEGGRREGFRTFSRKSAFPANPAGRWSVDVMTTSGQLIGRLSFNIEGGLDGPPRGSPQSRIAPAKPALERVDPSAR